MARQIKLKSLTDAQFQNYNGVQDGEIIFITDTDKLYVGKGSQPTIVNPTPTKETVGLGNVDDVKQIPFDELDNLWKKSEDVILDCGEF